MATLRNRYKKQTSTRRGRIILFSIILLVLAIIAGGIIYWSIYKKQIIRNTLENTIRNKSQGLYDIKYDQLKLDEVAGFLSVTQLSLEYDSLKYLKLVDQNMAPPSLLSIKIPEITVTGVKTPRALLDNEIVGSKLVIRNPVIRIIYTNSGKDSARTVPTKEVYEQILGNLDLIKMDTIEITGGQITTVNMKTGKQNIELLGSDIRLLDVAIDSLSNEDTTRFLFAKKVDIACAQVRWASDNKLYKYGIDSVKVSSFDNTVAVQRFFIEPQLNEDAFVRALPTQDDRFDFNIKNISVTGIDFRELFNEHVVADSVKIRSANFLIYRDLNRPRDHKNRVGTYPHQAIAKLPIPVFVNKIVIQSAYMEYKERGIVSKQSGHVKFFNTYAVISNLTNDKELVKKNNIMSVDISTSLLNKTQLKTNWNFYLLNPNGKFTVKGSLGRIEHAEDFSVLTEPMGPASIEDGTINGMEFNMTANDYQMSGTVRMPYEDLKIGVLKKDEDTKKLEKRKFISFAANLFVKNSNPSGRKDEVRVATVTNERDPNRSIFHFAWKTLFKGIKESVGINK